MGLVKHRDSITFEGNRLLVMLSGTPKNGGVILVCLSLNIFKPETLVPSLPLMICFFLNEVASTQFSVYTRLVFIIAIINCVYIGGC